MSPARKRPEKQAPELPQSDVRSKQDREQKESDFLRDLEKATSDQARKKLGLPSSGRD